MLLEKHWSFGIRLCCPVIPKLTNLSSSWDGKLFWEAIDAIGHYSTYGNGPLFLRGYASTSHWEPRQKNCLPDFAGFRLTLALGNLVVAGVGAVQGTHLEMSFFSQSLVMIFGYVSKVSANFSFRKSGGIFFNQPWCCPEQLIKASWVLT